MDPWRQFPLPIARLALRSRNAKSPKDRHDTAYFALEVSVRLAVAAHPPQDAGVLRRASLGVWIGQMRAARRSLEAPGILRLYELLVREGTGQREKRRAIRPRELFDALAAYRNQVVGHGSTRLPEYYNEAASVLQQGLDAAWQEHLFLPQGGRLVWVEGAELDPEGKLLGRVLELTGSDARILDPAGTALPSGVRPRRLYLLEEGSFRSLHPWLVYQEGSAREREALYCFNGLGRVASYLDYASGESLRGEELEEAFPGIAQEVGALFSGASAAEAPEDHDNDDPNRFGDYLILGKLGEGGMGVVYLARQLSLGRRVALKMLHPSRSSDLTAVARFRREIHALSRCEHPNVVKILASGVARETWYYAMEFVDGADLARVSAALGHEESVDAAIESAWEGVRAERSELFQGVPQVAHRSLVSPEAAGRHERLARLFHDAAMGVAHLHENGVLHRDIKPANLMVTHHDLRAVVMDLGLAAVDTASVTLTRDTSTILGTLRYLPPEQILRERGSVDQRSDVYSLGATFYELLGGQPLLNGETEAQLLHQVLHEEPKPLEKVDPGVPRDLTLIVRKALEKEPRMRYDSAQALAEDIQAFLEARPVSARPPTIGYLLKLWTRRNRRQAASIAASALLILVLTAWYVLSLMGALREKDAAVDRYTKLSDVFGAPAWIQEVVSLFPITPATIDSYETWLAREEDIASRRELYEARLEEPLREGERAEVERLISDIERLEGLRPVIVERLELARSLPQRTQDHPGWPGAIESIAASDAYGGLRIEPQLGLIPLQQNPQSGLWEFWHVNSGARPHIADPATGELLVTADSGIVLVLLPGGSFHMGTPLKDMAEGVTDEVFHQRELAPFFISKYETTQAQWERMFDWNPSAHQRFGEGEEAGINSIHPVENVPWTNVVTFGERLDLRLPTEPEWEFACRAKTTTVFSFGSKADDLKRYANVLDKTHGGGGVVDVAPWEDGYAVHAPVGTFLPNGFGLYDMHGNVSEWTADLYRADLSDPDSPPEEPPRRVWRGGAWSFYRPPTYFCRSAYRTKTPDHFREQFLGCRMARDLER